MKEKTILKVAVIISITIVCIALIITGNPELAVGIIAIIGLVVVLISWFTHVF